MMSTNADFLRVLREIEQANKAVVDLKVWFTGLRINPAGGLEALQREGSDWSGFRDQVLESIANRAAVYAEAQRVVAGLPAELTASLNTQSLIHDIKHPFFTDDWEIEKEEKLLKRIEALVNY